MKKSKHGMRRGFAYIFYGAPGIGKTETVLQLAHRTGRGIMTDEEFTREQMDEQRKEVSRLRSELKAFNKARATMSKEDKERTRQQAKDLQDQYDRVLGRLYTMRNYFQWNLGVDREYISAYDKD